MKVKLPCMFNTQPLNGTRHQIVTFFLPENNGVVNNKSRLSVNIGVCLLQSVDYLGTPLWWGHVLCLHEGRVGQKSTLINLILPHRCVKRSSNDMDTCTEPLTRSEKEKSSKCVRYTYIIKKEEGKKHYLVNNCQPSITCQKVISQFMVHILLDTNLPGGPTVHSITESNVRFLTSRKHLTLVLFLDHVPL